MWWKISHDLTKSQLQLCISWSIWQAECWGQLLKLRDGRRGPGWGLDRWLCWIGEFQVPMDPMGQKEKHKAWASLFFSPCFQVCVFGFWMFLVLTYKAFKSSPWAILIRAFSNWRCSRPHRTIAPGYPLHTVATFFPQQYPMFNFIMNIALSYRIQLL